MKVKIAREKLISLQNAIGELSYEVDGNKKPVRRSQEFAYALARNMALLEPIIKSIAKTRDTTLTEFDAEFKKLTERTDEKVKELEEKFAPAIEENKKFFEAEEEFELYEIKRATIGEISGAQMIGLLPLIKEE